MIRFCRPLTSVADDYRGGSALAAADELGLRVPEDLSVVGYHNTVFSRLHRLSLRTIDSHSAEVGQVAGPTLTARLDGENGTPGTRLLTPALVLRSSTGPAPRASAADRPNGS
jgi:DNA-binding LacI/PurR family transcriptional regulator